MPAAGPAKPVSAQPNMLQIDGLPGTATAVRLFHHVTRAPEPRPDSPAEGAGRAPLPFGSSPRTPTPHGPSPPGGGWPPPPPRRPRPRPRPWSPCGRNASSPASSTSKFPLPRSVARVPCLISSFDKSGEASCIPLVLITLFLFLAGAGGLLAGLRRLLPRPREAVRLLPLSLAHHLCRNTHQHSDVYNTASVRAGTRLIPPSGGASAGTSPGKGTWRRNGS